jgi:hypothetical protein
VHHGDELPAVVDQLADEAGVAAEGGRQESAFQSMNE